MAAYTVKDFADIYTAVLEELKLGTANTAATARIKRVINQVYVDEVVPFKRWGWLSGHTTVQFKPYYNTGTCTVTPDSTTVTLSVAPSVGSGSKAGYFFAVDNFSEIYTIESHTAGSTTVVLTTPYTGTLSSTAGFKIWTENVVLPTDCAETIEVWHDYMQPTMEALGFQEFRRKRNNNQRLEQRPYFYTTTDFYDPSTGDAETESDRYRVLKVFPAAYSNSTTLHIDYKKEVSALELDGDEPVMPIEDRVVLVYGTLARVWATEARNPEMGVYNKNLYDAKLARMAGKVEDSFDKPQITPDSSYLLLKRGPGIKGRSSMGSSAGGGNSYTAPHYLADVTINGATITNTVTVSSGVTIDGRDIGVDGATLDAHIADTSDAHDATAISVVASGNLAATDVGAALTELQGDIDTINTLADGKIYVGNASNAATEVTPSGDVTMTNAGVTAISAGVIVNADVNASAAIAYSKLNLATSIVNADISASAAIAYNKLALTGAILNADLAGSIAYSKLSLTGAILNADLAGSIAASKLVGSDIATVGTVTTGTWSASTIALNKGGTGQTTKAAAFDALSPLTTGGDLLYGGASGTGTRLANGSAGQFVQSAGSTNAPVYAFVPTDPNELENIGISASVAGSALTFTLTQADGSALAAGAGSARINFRSATNSTGTIVTRTAASAISVTVPSTATLGFSATPTVGSNVGYVYAIDNAGTVELAVSSSWLKETVITSTTAISTSADDNGFYSTTARTNVAFRMIGRFTYSTAPNGTYSAIPDTLTVGIASLLTAPITGQTTTANSAGLITYTDTAGQYGDSTSFILPPGTWNLSCLGNFTSGGATTTSAVSLGFSTTSGNSGTGQTVGDNRCVVSKNTSSGTWDNVSVFNYQVTPTTATTYYLKCFAGNSITNLQYAWSYRVERIA